jgi:8-oxo-dGTP diphosphatase
MKTIYSNNFILQLSIDCVIFGYKEKELKVLVPQLKLNKLYCTLPGGFILQNEGIDDSARRILEERTGLKDIYLEQFRVFGHANRKNDEVVENLKTAKNDLINLAIFDDNNLEWLGKRFISIGYYALVDIDKVSPQKTSFDESIDWYNIKNLPKMIIDHNEMVTFALETLRQNLDTKLIGFNLLPETFTMKEVQELYEAVYDRPFARNNFQKKILDMNVLERLEKKFTGAANKAPYLYRFKK